MLDHCILIALNKINSRNPFYYGFLTDLPWQTGPIDLQQWTATWTQQRYGRSSIDAEEAQLWREPVTTCNSCNRKRASVCGCERKPSGTMLTRALDMLVLLGTPCLALIVSKRHNVTVARGNTHAAVRFAAVIVVLGWGGRCHWSLAQRPDGTIQKSQQYQYDFSIMLTAVE